MTTNLYEFEIIFLLGLEFKKRKRRIVILFGLGDLFLIFLGFLGLL